MVLAVLASSHSFAYFEHLCTVTKVKTFSFNLETCAGDYLPAQDISDLPSISKGDCCDIDYKVNQADNAVQQNFDLKVNSFLAEEISFFTFNFESKVMVLAQEPALNHSNTSPPLKQAIYILNQQFIL